MKKHETVALNIDRQYFIDGMIIHAYQIKSDQLITFFSSFVLENDSWSSGSCFCHMFVHGVVGVPQQGIWETRL